MIHPVEREVLVLCVLLLVSDYHYSLCSALNYGSNAVEVERSVREVQGTRVRAKRFVLDSGEEVSERSNLNGDAYDDDELDNAEESSVETFGLGENMKPIETTTVSDTTSRPVTMPSPTLQFTKEPTVNVEDCCGLLRIGSFDEFERCLGDRCLAPNSCDGPEILERCFFEGEYYPVNTTVHLDEAKCYVVKCTRSSAKEPPSTQVGDFGTGCCTLAGQMYRDGAQVESETCREGNWTSEPTTTPITSTSPASTVSDETEASSTTSEETTTPMLVKTSPPPSTVMTSETSSPTETSLYTTPTIPAPDQQTSTGSTYAERETTEPAQYTTKTSTEIGATSSTTREPTPGEVASTPSSESTVEPGEEGTTSAVAKTEPSTEATPSVSYTKRFTTTEGIIEYSETTVAPDTTETVTDVAVESSTGAASFSPESTATTVVVVPRSTEGLATTSTTEATLTTKEPGTSRASTTTEETMQSTSLETGAETPSTKEVGTSEPSTTTEGVTTSSESPTSPDISETTTRVSVEVTEGLTSVSPEPAATTGAGTQSTEEVSSSTAIITTEQVTTSSESPVSPDTTETTTVSVESTEGLTSVSLESVATTGAETQSTEEISTPKASTAPEGTLVTTAITETTLSVPVESTEGLTSISPESTVTTSAETQSTKKVTTSEVTTEGTSVSVESTEAITSALPESTVTISAETQSTEEVDTSEASTSTEGVTVSPKSAVSPNITEATTSMPVESTEGLPSTTTEPSTTTPPDNYTCRWDNMTVSTGQTILRDPNRCLHVECWRTVHGAFIDVTIVHEARGCCELQDKQMVPPGYVTTGRGGKKRCIFGRWHTQYFDAAINMTSSKDLPFKSKTYHFFPRLTPINEALDICEKINGTLAVPDNREQELELGELGAEAFGGHATFYINQEKIQQHVMNGRDEENPEKYIVYPHDTKKMMHVKVNKPGTAYAVESFVENIQRLSVPICEQGGKNESFPEYFNNLVSIGTLTDQGLPKEAAYRGMRHGKDSKTLAKMHEWRLPPVPRKFRAGHTNLGLELRRWGQVHEHLAHAIKNKQTFKDPLPVYKANHFNVK